MDSDTLAPDVNGLMLDLTGPDQEASAAAELKLDALVHEGNDHAQRAALIVNYFMAQAGAIDRPLFLWRVEQVLRIASITGTLREMFYYSCDEIAARGAHAEFLAVLDAMADSGDDSATKALAEISDLIPPWVLQWAQQIRRTPPEVVAFMIPETGWTDDCWWVAPEIIAGFGPKAAAPAATQPPPIRRLMPWEMEPPSRWEKLKLWLSDRRWDAQLWLGDRWWDVRCRWWAVQDWWADLKHEGAE